MCNATTVILILQTRNIIDSPKQKAQARVATSGFADHAAVLPWYFKSSHRRYANDVLSLFQQNFIYKNKSQTRFSPWTSRLMTVTLKELKKNCLYWMSIISSVQAVMKTLHPWKPRQSKAALSLFLIHSWPLCFWRWLELSTETITLK